MNVVETVRDVMDKEFLNIQLAQQKVKQIAELFVELSAICIDEHSKDLFNKVLSVKYPFDKSFDELTNDVIDWKLNTRMVLKSTIKKCPNRKE